MNRQTVKKEKRSWFIVLGEYGYFSGLKYGGHPQWTSKYEEAKPLDDEAKFRTLQSMCFGQDLILDYIK